MIGDTNVCRVLFVALWVASHALHETASGNGHPRAETPKRERLRLFTDTSVTRVTVMYLTLLPPRPPYEYVYLYLEVGSN